MYTVYIDPTLTGGTATTLVTLGYSNSRGTYAFPGGDRLNRTTVNISASQKGSVTAPLASTGIKMVVSKTATSEACCTVAANRMEFDFGARYPLLGITSEEAGDSWDAFLAVMNSEEAKQAFLSGVIPQ